MEATIFYLRSKLPSVLKRGGSNIPMLKDIHDNLKYKCAITHMLKGEKRLLVL